MFMLLTSPPEIATLTLKDDKEPKVPAILAKRVWQE